MHWLVKSALALSSKTSQQSSCGVSFRAKLPESLSLCFCVRSSACFHNDTASSCDHLGVSHHQLSYFRIKLLEPQLSLKARAKGCSVVDMSLMTSVAAI
eukprot:3426267-Amphidinium_carterae.1